VSPEQIYEEHVDLIDAVIAQICRRQRLSPADAADFRQEAHLTLIQRGTLAKYEGRSSMRTFLSVVLGRVYKDFRIRQWGKWRPSVEARRQGRVAELLEQFIVRDGLAFDEAVALLQTNHGVTDTRAALEALAARLPLRVARRTQGDDVLVAMPSGAPAPDAIAAREEARPRIEDARQALLAELAALAPDDRLVIKLRYMDGLKVVDIAGLMQTDARRLYRHIEQLLARLRAALAARGIDSSDLFDEDAPWE
jgi:RNA polymerase sigma factor for flagellar operon FliA